MNNREVYDRWDRSWTLLATSIKDRTERSLIMDESIKVYLSACKKFRMMVDRDQSDLAARMEQIDFVEAACKEKTIDENQAV